MVGKSHPFIHETTHTCSLYLFIKHLCSARPSAHCQNCHNDPTRLIIVGFLCLWDFAAMTNTWKKSFKRKRDASWLPVSGFKAKVSWIHLAWGEIDAHSSRSMWQRMLISRQPGSREESDVYYTDDLSLQQTPRSSVLHWPHCVVYNHIPSIVMYRCFINMYRLHTWMVSRINKWILPSR